MIFLFSGEGKTDLGVTDGTHTGVCPPLCWLPGPMTLLIDDIVQSEQQYSPLESQCFYFISEILLNKLARKISIPPLRGTNMNIYHSRGAQALAALALALSQRMDTAVVAIYFHDCDGTNSSPSERHRDMHFSMQERGFKLFGLKSGVPMIPNPKSEAWLLCALKEHPYQNCDQLELSSGNDNSPNSLKTQLKNCLKRRGLDISGDLRQTLNNLIQPLEGEKQIDFLHIDMPSFCLFYEELKEAIQLTDNNWKEEYDPSLNKCIDIASNLLDI